MRTRHTLQNSRSVDRYLRQFLGERSFRTVLARADRVRNHGFQLGDYVAHPASALPSPRKTRTPGFAKAAQVLPPLSGLGQSARVSKTCVRPETRRGWDACAGCRLTSRASLPRRSRPARLSIL